jgi:hypothetical protein
MDVSDPKGRGIHHSIPHSLPLGADGIHLLFIINSRNISLKILVDLFLNKRVILI